MGNKPLPADPDQAGTTGGAMLFNSNPSLRDNLDDEATAR
jgi:hypothetical protein